MRWIELVRIHERPLELYDLDAEQTDRTSLADLKLGIKSDLSARLPACEAGLHDTRGQQ